MRINSYDNNTNFGIKFKTENIIDIISQEPISQIGRYESAREFVTTFYKAFTGNHGYWKRAQAQVPAILAKYPQLKEAAEQISVIKEQNPSISVISLREKVRPIIKKLGQEIDIEI